MMQSPTPSQVMTIGDLLHSWERAEPGRLALIFPDARLTYADLAIRVRDLARGLVSLGVKHGDQVGILLPSGAEQVAAVYACALIGAISIPINARYRSEELRHVLIQGDVRVLLSADVLGGPVTVDELLRDGFEDWHLQQGEFVSLADAPQLERVVLLEGGDIRGTLSGSNFLAKIAETPVETIERLRHRTALRDPLMILFTSGTTSMPKGAVISHEAFVRLTNACRDQWFALEPHDRVWTALPFFHVGGLVAAGMCLAAGCTLVHTGFFSVEIALQQLENEKITVGLPMVEALWLATLNALRDHPVDLSSMRLVMSTGAPERLSTMQDALPQVPLVTLYGSTETTALLSVGNWTDDREQRLETHGLPLPGIEVEVRDTVTGAALPHGELGELVHRGWARFERYYNAPEATAEVIDSDGWFHSGDLATIDVDGRLTWKGRIKDMLKVGGENVAALEIENYLLRHPAVEMVAVFGVRDDYYTEVPAAVVQLRDGASADEETLIRFCLGRIAGFKVPRYIRILEGDWPMSGTKIKKNVLQATLTKELDDRGITTAPKPNTRQLPADRD